MGTPARAFNHMQFGQASIGDPVWAAELDRQLEDRNPASDSSLRSYMAESASPGWTIFPRPERRWSPVS